jgi:P4 family phage/plasmid primase-like protien
VDTTFRRSGLMRPKWGRDDYRERTLTLACGPRDPLTDEERRLQTRTLREGLTMTIDALLRDPCKYTKLGKLFIAQQTKAGTHYLYHDGQIYHYTGTRYKAVTEEALDFSIRSCLEKGGYPVNNNVIRNVIPNVKNRTRSKSEPPADLGADDWPQGDVIAFGNGLLDVSAGVLRDHTPLWFSTACLPYNYDPAAACPVWTNFLSQVMEGDAERIALLQEWIGYCLSHDTSLQKFMVFQGATRGGKGTCACAVLESLVGTENSTAVILESLADRFALLPLLEKTVALVNEVDFKGVKNRQQIINRLKAIVGEDRLPVEWKGINRVTVTRLRARFTISCNDPLSFLDPSAQVAARMLTVPFNVSFLGKEDPKLSDKIALELPGVVNWALEGLGATSSPAGPVRRAGCLQGRTGRSAAARTPRHWRSQRRASSWSAWLVPNPKSLPGVMLVDEPQTVWGEQLREAFEMWKSYEGLDGDYRWMVRDFKALLPSLEAQRKDSPLAQPGQAASGSVLHRHRAAGRPPPSSTSESRCSTGDDRFSMKRASEARRLGPGLRPRPCHLAKSPTIPCRHRRQPCDHRVSAQG